MADTRRTSGFTVRMTVNRLPDFRRRFPAFVQAAITKATFDTLAQAQTRTPVRTGNLKNSLAAEIGTDGIGVFTGQVFSIVEYAPYVEYGTRAMEAQPYLTPAFEAVADSLERALKAGAAQI